MSTLRLLTANTFFQLVGKVATAGSTLLVTRMIADAGALGREGYGQFSIATVYAAYFYILVDFGLNAIAAKYMTEDESRIPRYLSNLLGMRLVMATALVVVGLALLSFMPYSPLVKFGCMVMLLTVLAQAVITNNNALFQIKLRYDQAVIANVAGVTVMLVLVYLTYMAQGGLIWYLISMVIGYAVMSVMGLILVQTHARVRMAFEWPLWRQLFVASLPLGITMIFNLAYFKADTFILSFVQLSPAVGVTNEEAVGLYNNAYKWFEIALVIPLYIVNVLYPIMLRTFQRNPLELRPLFGKSLLGMLGISVVGLVLLELLSPLLIDLSTSGNADFASSVTVLRLLSLWLPFFFATGLFMWMAMTLGKQRWLVFIYAVAAVINIGLNLWLIPLYGYIAAAITTGVTEAVTFLLLAVVVWPLLSKDRLAALAAPAPASVVNTSESSVYEP